MSLSQHAADGVFCNTAFGAEAVEDAAIAWLSVIVHAGVSPSSCIRALPQRYIASRIGKKAFTERRQRVIDAGRNDRINCAGNQTVFFQFAELLGQHFRRRFGDETVQLVEAQRLTGQVPEQQRFIFAAD